MNEEMYGCDNLMFFNWLTRNEKDDFDAMEK